MPFAVLIALALSAALIPSSAGGQVATILESMPTADSVESYVRSYFADEPVLIAIAQCESHFRQFDKDGSVLRGKALPEDVGIMQINERYHKKSARAQGHDLYTIEGNLAYARYLYQKEGTTPWLASAKCWRS